jgi:serine/threonine-protein kinase
LSSAAHHLVPVTASAPLETLDEYRLIARLGRGGMAEIMLASRPGAHGPELVVVKRLHEEDADDAVILRMFLDESRLSLRFRHPNIVRADALGMVEGRHALAMEFLEGQPLQIVLKRGTALQKRLPLDRLVAGFADVLDGLHYAHELADEQGKPLHVIHRDVSPHNLFVTTSGNVKLLDFGIAKTRIQENRTHTGLLKGKVAYMAPEQAHGARVDRRADIWSAGVTLWEAIAGTRLFKADNEAASLRLTLSGPIARLGEVRDDVPPELELMVMRALRREPAARFPTAAAMAAELRAWGEKQGAPLAAPLRDVMNDFFGREVAEQRIRLHALMSASEAVPVSSSMPILATSAPVSSQRRVIVANASPTIAAAAPDSNGTVSDVGAMTHGSTVTEFVDRLHRDQRLAFRWLFVLVGVLGAAVVALGIAFAARVRGAPVPATTPARSEVRQGGPSTPPSVPPGTARAPAAIATPTSAASPGAVGEAFPKGNVRARTAAPKQRREGGNGSVAVMSEPVREPAPVEPRPVPAPLAPTRAVVEYGFLTLDTTPWSHVSVDGSPLGQTPIVRARLPAGLHTLTLANGERGIATTYQVSIEAGKTSVKRLGLD